MYVKTLDGKEQENLYDGEGLRAGLKENGKASTFVFKDGEILAECDVDNALVRRYMQGVGLSHVQTMEDGAYHAYHKDEQGSTAYVTGNSSAVENCYVYDAFGNVLEKQEDIRSRILYTGQQYDQETNQYYLRARYYNPLIGRFAQEDIYRGDGLNLYAYCGNNPVMYYDPSGHNMSDYQKQPANEFEPVEGADAAGTDVVTGLGYDAGDTPVRIDGDWTENDMKQALLGHPPRGLGNPDIHHGGQMPGGALHEVLPGEHRSNAALHQSLYNQGVTAEMRMEDRQLHWWYRAREQGADELLPDWIYD
ncbi:MAG: RHS repeat-associated core domain-containing protein [Lachnospiraceae bacterium]|nr:RHS repeat-associated core domain-containing protein [Lachnospiraceae bacterium]